MDLRKSRLFSVILLAVSLLALGGCTNRVVSQEPWFHDDPAAKGPSLRDGVWLSEDPKCKVDEARPAEQWPACAQWSYLRGNQSFSPQWREKGTGQKHRRTYDDWAPAVHLVIAAGDPIISQSMDCPNAAEKAAEPVDASDVAAATVSAPAPTPSPESEPPARYCYSGLRVITADDRGEITALETWPVFCGPLPEGGGDVTDTPWPGLQVAGKNCTASSEAALRDAARRSRDLWTKAMPLPRAHWVRGGTH